MTADPSRRRVLLPASPAIERTPYVEAAAAIGIDLTSDPEATGIDGVLGADGGGARIASAAAERLELPWHPRRAVDASLDPLLARGRLMAAGLAVPWFFAMPSGGTLASVADRIRFPCVIKPAGRRGAVRVADAASFERALAQVRATPAAGEPSSGSAADVMVEAFVPGDEIVLQGALTQGALHVLAMGDAPGVSRPCDESRTVAGMVAHAAAALGLRHGPLHAECRVQGSEALVLGVWPWPIVATGPRGPRFAPIGDQLAGRGEMTLAEILLRHALGESLEGFGRLAG